MVVEIIRTSYLGLKRARIASFWIDEIECLWLNCVNASAVDKMGRFVRHASWRQCFANK
jgi:hypothetical protein